MAYVLAPNQTVQTFPYSLQKLRQDNPLVSFPTAMPDSALVVWNVFPVQPRPTPSFDRATQNCSEVNPTFENNEWVQTWLITQASADQIAERLAEQEELVREERNEALSECDWTQLPDSPLDAATKTAWATYRQELRDVTAQAGFPWNVIWPTAPS